MNCITYVKASLLNFFSFDCEFLLSNFSDNSTPLWPIEPLKHFLEEQRAYCCPEDLQTAIVTKFFFCFFVNSVISVRPIVCM